MSSLPKHLSLLSSPIALALGLCFQIQAQNTPNRITHAVEEANRVVLAGNTRPEADGLNDRGRIPDNSVLEHMQLLLKGSPEQDAALEAFLAELHDPSSPNYHRWIGATEFGRRFGPSQQDLDTVQHWLLSQGFGVNVVYPSGKMIDFSGSAGQVRTAFNCEIHALEVRGERHIANMSDPAIPAALEPVVHGVVSLHDFRPKPHSVQRPQYTFKSGGSTFEAVVPQDLATIYNLTPLFTAGYSGKGQSIVLIEDTYLHTVNDWTTFRSTFGLSSYTSGSLTQEAPAPASGTNNCTAPGVNGDDGEAAIDVEWATAAAPNAAIILAACGDTSTTFGGLIALQNLLSKPNPPAIVSISYGEAEVLNGATANAAYKSAYALAVSEGVSVFVSSGDEGAASSDADLTKATHGIGISGFASTPYNVAVGGLDFGDTYAGSNSTYWNSANTSVYGSAKSYVPEIPWNDSCASQLASSYLGYPATYGSTGFCNSYTARSDGFLTTASGSGGPSGCATGSPSTSGVVSGTCKGYAKPSWQSVYGNPSDSVRDIPDVALFASNGVWGHYYVVCYSDRANGGTPCTGAPDTWSGFGGTSVASPIMAGIQALVNQRTGSSWGNPNTVYYKLASTEYGTGGSSSCNSTLGKGVASSCIFNDVTLGDMDAPCTGSHSCYDPSGTYGVLSTSNTAYQPAYAATKGWDFPSGIGSVNAYNLVMQWSTGAPSSVHH